MKDDLKRATVLIIQRGIFFLQGRILRSREFQWSRSPYDAWKTRNEKMAKAVAEHFGADLMLFNPITSELRAYRDESERNGG